MAKEVESILERIANFHRLDVLWKGIGVDPRDCGLSPEHTLHCNAFCRMVKSNPALLKKCIDNDNLFMLADAQKKQVPFVRSCHAGVSELVIPVLTDGRVVEVILLGIFREPKMKCPYPEMQKLFDALPLHLKTNFTETGLLLNDLVPILRFYRESQYSSHSHIKDSRIVTAIKMIHKRFADKITVSQISSEVHLSESRFLHLFKSQTGASFIGYLLKVRLQKAAELLRLTDLSISDIMDHSGFNNQSYFTVQFKNYTGYSPLKYRNNFAECRDI